MTQHRGNASFSARDGLATVNSIHLCNIVASSPNVLDCAVLTSTCASASALLLALITALKAECSPRHLRDRKVGSPGKQFMLPQTAGPPNTAHHRHSGLHQP